MADSRVLCKELVQSCVQAYGCQARYWTGLAETHFLVSSVSRFEERRSPWSFALTDVYSALRVRHSQLDKVQRKGEVLQARGCLKQYIRVVRITGEVRRQSYTPLGIIQIWCCSGAVLVTGQSGSHYDNLSSSLKYHLIS